MRRIWLILVGILLLLGAAQAQNIITPEQATQAVQQFMNDPGLELTVYELRDDGPVGGRYYEVRAKDYPQVSGLYTVRATDGKVMSMLLDNPNMNEQPALSQQEAQAIAEEFARRHYPSFSQGQWWLYPHVRNEGEYNFYWHPVLNSRYGTLPYTWYLLVVVDGVRGRVVTYFAPPDRPILAPTVPRVSLAQAKVIAAPYARYLLTQVPFNEIYLRVTEDQWGIQRLEWHLNQCPNPTEAPTLHYGVHVDASTGEVLGIEAPISSPLRKEPPTRAVPPLPTKKIIQLRLGSPKGRLVGSSAMPVIENGTLWVRAELLRGFGAQVQVDRKAVEIRVGEKSVSGASVGAKWRDYGWWIPLRQTASVLNWRVDWLPLAQEAVVHNGIPHQGDVSPSRLPARSDSR